MSSATVHDLVGRMEEAGVIEDTTPPSTPQQSDTASARSSDSGSSRAARRTRFERLREIEGIRAIHLTMGEWDVILRVIAEATDSLRELMFERIANMDGFSRSQSMVVPGTDYEVEGPPI